VGKRISKRAQKNQKKENAVTKCLDFASAPASECGEPEAEPLEQLDLDAEPVTMADPSENETTQVLPDIDAEDEDLEQTEGAEEGEARELTEDEKLAAAKQDLVEFFESSSFALAMQARLLSKMPNHELNFGRVVSTLAAADSILPRSVMENVTLVWKKDNKWIKAWLANELCDPNESEKTDEIPEDEAGLLDFYAMLSADTKEAATALSEKPDSEFNFGLMCSTLSGGALPAEVSKSLAMKWKTDQSWVRTWLAGKLSTA